MNFIIIIAIILILLITIPIGLSFGIYKFIKNRNYNKSYRWIALSPIVITSYFIYDTIYPGDGFYKDDFTEVTGLTLPNDSEIKFKSATFPDHFGDYTSISIIKVGGNFYDSLKSILVKREFQELKDQSIFSDKILKIHTDGYVIKTFNIELAGKEFTVDFLSDKETIIVQRASW